MINTLAQQSVCSLQQECYEGVADVSNLGDLLSNRGLFHSIIRVSIYTYPDLDLQLVHQRLLHLSRRLAVPHGLWTG